MSSAAVVQKRLETILDGAIANGHAEMSFAAAGLTVKDQGTALSDEVRSEIGTEQRLSQRRLQSEVELINGLEEGKVSLAGAALQAGLLAVRHLFGQQKSEKVAIAPVFFLGSFCRLLVGSRKRKSSGRSHAQRTRDGTAHIPCVSVRTVWA
jgi:hypothetical protein